MDIDSQDMQVFRVIKSRACEYSIWSDTRPLPRGWEAVDMVGSKSACLSYIDREWTALSPASVAAG
jgi:uncharacterized protein YbdZ (MbtH family)